MTVSTISEEEWAIIKPRFYQLYRNENRTLKQTIEILRHEGFRVTERMCKIQIRRWNFHKHNNDRELLHLLRKHAELEKTGQKVKFRIKKRPVSVYAAQRHFERKNIQVNEELALRLPLSPTPSVLSVLSVDENEAQSASSSSSTYDTSLESDKNAKPHPLVHSSKRNSHRLVSQIRKRAQGSRPQTLISLRSPDAHLHAEAVLVNVRGLCGITINTIQQSGYMQYPLYKIRVLHGGIRKVTYHLRNRNTQQALVAYEESQQMFWDMLKSPDPWLLPAVFHFLFDYLSDRNENATLASFIIFMAKMSATISHHHPIALLINELLSGYCDPLTIEVALRLSGDLLDDTIGRYHDITFCLNRIRTFALDYFGLHSDTETVLVNDLADVGLFFGPSSPQNLSRLFSLAGCLYRKGDLDGALRVIGELLNLLPKQELEPYCSERHDKQVSMHSVTGSSSPSDLGHGYREDTAQAAGASLKLWLHENEATGISEHVIQARQPVLWLDRGAPGGFWTYQTPSTSSATST